MNHKEIERWYRLRNLRRACQVLMVVAVALLVCGYAASRMWPRSPDTFVVSPTTNAGIQIKNFSYSSPGAHPWELKASTALVNNTLDSVALTAPSVVYHGGKGGTISLTAKSGTLDKKGGKVVAQGEVRIAFGNFLFSADAVHYWHEKLFAETPSEVSLEGGDLSLTGKGMTLSVEDEEIVIEKDVKALLYNVKWVEPGQRLPL